VTFERDCLARQWFSRALDIRRTAGLEVGNRPHLCDRLSAITVREVRVEFDGPLKEF
jgi:hypothetical protein